MLELKVVEDTFPTTVNLLLLVVSQERFAFPPNTPPEPPGTLNCTFPVVPPGEVSVLVKLI